MLTDHRPEPLRAPALEQLTSAGIRHGFFTRSGGVSEGLYRGLNVGLGSRDDRSHILENRARVATCLGVPAANLCTTHQIHSTRTVVAKTPFTGKRPQADAVVTDRPGLALGVLAADCGPVLLADPDARVIGAAHAGWQGAFAGILESAIEAMEGLGARREHTLAVLGPSISQQNYEVGPEFVARFEEDDADNARYFAASDRPGHALFDLNAYTVDRLAKAGVSASLLGRCTYADDTLFYSYRRSTHRKEPDYGRQISAIVLEDI